MEHAFSDSKHVDERFAADSESVFTDSFQEFLHFWLISLEQVLTRDQIEDCGDTCLVKIRSFVAVPEARHEEVVVCYQVGKRSLNVDKPLFNLIQRWWAIDDTHRTIVLHFLSVIALTGDSPHLISSLLFISYSGKPSVSTRRHLRVHSSSVFFQFSDLRFRRWFQQLLRKLLLFKGILLLFDPIDLSNCFRNGITEDLLQEIAI